MYSSGPLHTDEQKLNAQLETYIQHLCADIGCSLGDLPEAIDHIDGWRERAREICSGSVT